MKFENVYWDWDEMRNDNKSPSILAIGDSWFWYPFPGGSLLNYIGPLVATGQHSIFALGNNGAEAYDYVYGKYRSSVRESLKWSGQGLSAVLLSGGGNDFSGFTDLRPLLKSRCGSETTAAGCYRPGNGNKTLEWLMAKIIESYRSLIGQVYVACRPGITVFVHNYDYAIPTGIGVFGSEPWLKSALRDAEVPEHLRLDCIKHLIDRFTAMLKTLVTESSDRVVLVDSRNTLAPGDWANELHPNAEGFRKIAREKWRPQLAAHGLT